MMGEGGLQPPHGCLSAQAPLPDALPMTFRSRIALFTLLASLAAAAPAAAQVKPPAKTPTIGIADQKPDFLSDPRFLSLHMTHARVSVPWDVLKTPAQTFRMEIWLNAARAHHV